MNRRYSNLLVVVILCLACPTVTWSAGWRMAKIQERADAERAAQAARVPTSLIQLGATAEEVNFITKTFTGLLASGLKPEAAATITASMLADIKANTETQQAQEATKSFLGFNWGFGIGVSTDLSGGHRAADAEVVNGLVRIKEDSREVPRIFLETHKFFSVGEDAAPTFGHGPFVGIQSSHDQVLDSFAVGYLVGWRKAASSSSSLNFGVGFVVDPHVQVLGDGIEANKALPTGETEVRFKKESRFGLVLLTSFTF